jgi:hypothetical protein
MVALVPVVTTLPLVAVVERVLLGRMVLLLLVVQVALGLLFP